MQEVSRKPLPDRDGGEGEGDAEGRGGGEGSHQVSHPVSLRDPARLSGQTPSAQMTATAGKAPPTGRLQRQEPVPIIAIEQASSEPGTGVAVAAEIDERPGGGSQIGAQQGLTSNKTGQSEQQDTPEQDKVRRPSQFEAVDEVRQNFVHLLEHNKLQCFYLGALMFCLINIALDVCLSPSRWSCWWFASSSSSSPLVDSCLFSRRQTLLLGSFLSFLLLLRFLVSSAVQQFAKPPPRQTRTRAWSEAAGVCLVMLQAYLFVWRFGGWPLVEDKQLGWLMAAAHLQPLLLALQSCGRQTLAQRLIGQLCWLCPTAVWLILRAWPMASSTNGGPNWWTKLTAELVCLAGASFLGFQRKSAFHATVQRRAFAGANQLIEAKVSLEHQRQQQETLLLSVLPAYVAEQVKRNMLRSTTGGGGSGGTSTWPGQDGPPLVGAPSTPGATPSPPPLQSLLKVQLANTERFSFSSSISRVSLRRYSLQQQQQQQTQNPTTKHAPGAIPQVNVSQATSVLGAACSAQVQSTGSLWSCNLNQLNGGSPAGPNQGAAARRGFNELYIRTHNNVSLLYGDIVGFTRLCTQLSSSQLVGLLNDLFSRFDFLAERHKIMRIKILGDCYYGVGGIPEYALMGAKTRAAKLDNHAINCVNMGLDMIQYIRCLNQVQRASPKQPQNHELPDFELNMRIGIHTGHIHSGVIGLKKWQFDVWSNDVSIAMHCESSGEAGRVQVTEATRQQLNGTFACEPVPEWRRDAFLVEREVLTYFIKEESASSKRLNLTREPLSTGHNNSNNNSHNNNEKQDLANRSNGSNELDNIRKATIGTIRQTALPNLNGCRRALAGCALCHHDLGALNFTYRDKSLDKLYLERAGHSLLEQAGQLLLALGLILPLVTFWSGNWQLAALTVGSTLVFLSASLFLSLGASDTVLSSSSSSSSQLTDDLEHGLMPPDSALNDATTTADQTNCWPKHQVIRHKQVGSKPVPVRLWRFARAKIRPILNKLASRLGRRVKKQSSPLRECALFSLFCLLLGGQLGSNQLKLSKEDQLYLSVIVLLMALDSSPSLMSYKSRVSLLLVICLLALAFATLLHQDTLDQQLQVDSGGKVCDSTLLTSDQASWAIVLVLALLSVAFARQLEYATRASFLWRNRLNVDHEELEYISGINKVLLENILPSHVVQYYLTHPGDQLKSHLNSHLRATFMRMSFSNMRSFNEELYHEQHDNVAVMFASIPHFYEFYDESDISKQGLGCIALLNEIICDFDKLLLKNKFSRIEKIKTIGSTYMAAAGLRPNSSNSPKMMGRSSSTCSSTVTNSASECNKCTLRPGFGNTEQLLTPTSEERRPVLSQQKLNLICMVQFAASLMAALNGINRQSFQGFKLRVGLNTGPVVAGVIGAQRPFYDIWGDCVNIASRMESLGQVGRIQVEQKTAELLMESLGQEAYSIVRRGSIDVKGKGGMVTYFVDKRSLAEPSSREGASSCAGGLAGEPSNQQQVN